MTSSAFGIDHGEFSKDYNYALGGTLSATKDSPKGKKMKAYRSAWKETAKASGKGAAVGAPVGAALGAGMVAAHGYEGVRSPRALAAGAALGAIGGAATGGSINSMRPDVQRKVYNRAVQKNAFGIEEISKFGEWKTIEHRERTQRGQRKTMRRAGAVAGLGAGGVATGAHYLGDKKVYSDLGRDAHRIASFKSSPPFKSPTTAQKAGYIAGEAARHFGDLSMPGKVGLAAIGGAGAVAGGAKLGHTYQQHKVNQRRRANFKRSQL